MLICPVTNVIALGDIYAFYHQSLQTIFGGDCFYKISTVEPVIFVQYNLPNRTEKSATLGSYDAFLSCNMQKHVDPMFSCGLLAYLRWDL